MDNKKKSHDILNCLERLRIMHDLVKDQNFSVISKEEIQTDLTDTLKELDEKFKKFLADN